MKIKANPIRMMMAGLVAMAGVATFSIDSAYAATQAQTQAQPQAQPDVQAQLAQQGLRIARIAVIGNERIEADTIATYLTIGVGEPFDAERIDQSLKTLFGTGLFSDVVIERDGQTMLIRVVENPVINRVIFEGNSRLKQDKLLEEVQLRPRMIYTRARVRQDTKRIMDLYRKSGRFAAVVEPKIIQLEQNRVNLIFEISEGPKSRISRINFIGNEIYNDRELRNELYSRESRWWRILSSNDTYDPDRLGGDREVLRNFYFQHGYADFRIISAVAELTPDQKDFFVTFVVEEGEVYKFGDIKVESDIPELTPAFMRGFAQVAKDQIYNAKAIEDSVESMSQIGGVLGYAFLDVQPDIKKAENGENVLDVTFRIAEAPKTYVEKIVLNGNVRTRDNVIRREFRLAEGDSFNSIKIRRSESRLNGLGFFKEVTFEEVPGSGPDRVIIDVTVEEQATGQLELGGGFSSLDNFFLNFTIAETNLFGRGQQLRLSTLLSGRQKTINLSFTEPYLLGTNIGGGADIFRSDFDYIRESGYRTVSTGGSLRIGFPLSEYIQTGLRYTLRNDDVTVGGSLNSPFLADSQGNSLTSLVGYTLRYDTVDNFLYPSRGTRMTFSQDFAGLGGSIRYLKSNFNYDFYSPLPFGFIYHLGAEGGYVHGLGQNVRINDRFFLGGPQMRGFETSGLGPRDRNTNYAIGGNLFYVASTGFQIPMGAAASEMGLQVHAFVDVGAVAGVDLKDYDINGNPIDNSSIFSNGSPRVSVGVGVGWDSPFGPFRIDMAQVIVKQPYDRTEFLQFNIGTRF